MDTADAFHSLVGGTDYPMFIVTTNSGDERSGCLVGFLAQGSIDPPRLVVMLSKVNRTYRVAQAATELVVHFLHLGNRDLASLFGEQTDDTLDKFELCKWSQVPGVGPPVLAGTRGFVAGPILNRIDAGDHVAHLIDVAVARLDQDGPQLSFQGVKGMNPGHPA